MAETGMTRQRLLGRMPALLGITALLLVGISGETSGAEPADVPLTQRGMAAIALDYLPSDYSHVGASYIDRRHPVGFRGADFRYHADGEDDGDLLAVEAWPTRKPQDCGDDARCVALGDDDGDPVYLNWAVVEPEEDPGLVAVWVNHPGVTMLALYAGPDITRDPRTMDLPISVEAMRALVTDDRLRLMTTQEVVDAGRSVPRWRGSQPDPYSYQRLPQTDVGQAYALPVAWGSLGRWADARRSPVRHRFGPDAVGGRVVHLRGWAMDPTTIDAVAARRTPDFLRRPCHRDRFAGHCVRTGPRQRPIHFLWRPAHGAKPGVVWVTQRRDRVTVALRLVGGPVPERRKAAMRASGFHDWLRYAIRDRGLGLVTDKRVLDKAAKGAIDAS